MFGGGGGGGGVVVQWQCSVLGPYSRVVNCIHGSFMNSHRPICDVCLGFCEGYTVLDSGPPP